jgi:hypothetical protein
MFFTCFRESFQFIHSKHLSEHGIREWRLRIVLVHSRGSSEHLRIGIQDSSIEKQWDILIATFEAWRLRYPTALIRSLIEPLTTPCLVQQMS